MLSLIQTLLRDSGARFNARLSRAELTELLRSHGRTESAAVLDCEALFGGWSIADSWTIGVAECIDIPEGDQGLVPVARTPDDLVAFIDANGHGFFQDLIEDPQPRRVSTTTEGLVLGIAIWTAHHGLSESQRRVYEGKIGLELSTRLGLPKLETEFADETWWADTTTWIVERGDRTLIGARSADQLRLLPTEGQS